RGVLVLELSPTSPAEQAGVLAGDTIREVEDRRITNIYDYLYALRAFESTDTLRFVVYRDSTNVVLRVPNQ
ncbi:MAG: PDZ domain-containing protein, partial [Candidatus Latescibacteria bacterium]|nr:PDZ domain-containing protein [Candidatus Latescibacterota bacterium]